LSYYKEKYEFTKTEVIEFIRQSNKLNSIGADVELILSDYEEAVNLLKQDGLAYVFIHRSFQEYFAAYAIVHIMSDKFSDLLPALRRRLDDNVISMCFEMNRGLVVQKYIQPTYEGLHAQGKLVPATNAKFYFLEKLDVQYGCHFGVRPGTTEMMMNAMSMHMDEKFTELLHNVNKIQGVKHLNRGLTTMMFEYSVFETVSGIVERAKSRVGQSIKIDGETVLCLTFKDGQALLSDISDIRSRGVSNTDAITIRLREKDIKELMALDDRIGFEAKKIVGWCDEEVTLNANRVKTLAEIFDI
jgi:hypothetical protein